MNLKTSQKGFTIVELLIVIVVIAILAAISIVAYVGIQNNARASERQSDATNIAKVAETYFATNSTYPADAAAFSASTNAKLPANVEIKSPLLASGATASVTAEEKNATTGAKIYTVKNCGANVGGVVYYFDPRSGSEGGQKSVKYGAGC